jgi:hypothetical protein
VYLVFPPVALHYSLPYDSMGLSMSRVSRCTAATINMYFMYIYPSHVLACVASYYYGFPLAEK